MYSDSLIPNAKLLYGYISGLCSLEGYCFASNAYFTQFFKRDGRPCSLFTVSRWISMLKEQGHVRIDEVKMPSGNVQRRIYLTITVPVSARGLAEKRKVDSRNEQDPLRKSAKGVGENRKHKNITNTKANEPTAAIAAGGGTPLAQAKPKCWEIYQTFLQKQNGGGAGGKGTKTGETMMNAVLAEVQKEVERARAAGNPNVVDDPAEAICNAWARILENWYKLPLPFLGGRTTLRHINDNFSDIIGAIKNGKNAGKNTGGGFGKHAARPTGAELADAAARLGPGDGLDDATRERLKRV